jgi:hypothetical protein
MEDASATTSEAMRTARQGAASGCSFQRHVVVANPANSCHVRFRFSTFRSLAKNGPAYLRWALIEAAHNAARDPLYRELVARTRVRHGRRGGTIATITIARKLAEAIWWMLTRNQPFTPAGAKVALLRLIEPARFGGMSQPEFVAVQFQQ